MAVIKIFDSKGVKTLKIEGTAMEQPYDAEEEETEQVEEQDVIDF